MKRMAGDIASNQGEKAILEQFLAELNCEVGAIDTSPPETVTKGQALIKSMVNEAVKGDQKMLANVLKLIDKLDLLRQEEVAEAKPFTSKADWELAFAFHGKYKTLIEQEIERLKQHNPSYWSFDWFTPTLESAPWYDAVCGNIR